MDSLPGEFRVYDCRISGRHTRRDIAFPPERRNVALVDPPRRVALDSKATPRLRPVPPTLQLASLISTIHIALPAPFHLASWETVEIDA
jgi:hypothetical protein